MGYINIGKEFLISVNTNYNGKNETIEFDMDFSMHDDDSCAVPEYDYKLTLGSKITIEIDKNDLDDLKDEIKTTIHDNYTSKFTDGCTIELNANFFEQNGMWDIVLVK